MFQAFPKLTRFSHDWTITEKLDGSNGQVLIVRAEEVPITIDPITVVTNENDEAFCVFAGSRNRLLDTSKQGDSYGFAKFVQERAADFVRLLGEGRHFGEWYGAGIQRKYGLPDKRFALFNTHRWTGAELPDRVEVVPVLFEGYLTDSSLFDRCLAELKAMGSRAVPNFMNPEGIVMYHGPSQTTFKKTFDYDEAGKWLEKEAKA